jgi:hypothetical protein
VSTRVASVRVTREGHCIVHYVGGHSALAASIERDLDDQWIVTSGGATVAGPYPARARAVDAARRLAQELRPGAPGRASLRSSPPSPPSAGSRWPTSSAAPAAAASSTRAVTPSRSG